MSIVISAQAQAARLRPFASSRQVLSSGLRLGLSVPLALALCLSAPQAAACEFNYDNDQFAFKGMDSGYTGGFALACAPRLDDTGATQWRVAVELHTPRRIGWRSPVHSDRPYASLLTVARLRSSLDAEGTTAHQRGLALGVLGSPTVASLQNRWHELVGYNGRARGWRNQISNGGEPTMLYTSLRQHLLRPGYGVSDDANDDDGAGDAVGFTDRIEVQAVSGYRVGYRTEALVGAIARIGARTRPWWTLAPDGTAQAGGGGQAGAYAVAGATLRLVGYDALLQGQFRDSAVRLSSSEVVPVVAHAWLRIGAQTRGQLDYAFTLHHETEDTRRSFARPLSWGTLSISKSF
jgi:hypothetical protein